MYHYYKSSFPPRVSDEIINQIKEKVGIDGDRFKKFFSNDKAAGLIMLGYGGSYAYGTNVEGSDIDIRGVYMNPPSETLGTFQDRGQVQSIEYDITVYTLSKMMYLFGNCNPNTIELLGLRDEDYLYINKFGYAILYNKEIFLSKKCIYTFGNYALSQLNRLVNRSGRANDEILHNEARSLTKDIVLFKARYKDYVKKIDVIEDEGENTIKFDMEYDKIPINILSNILSELNSIHKNYCKSDRNDKAIAHNKLSKHMMHLVRLYMMGYDILKDKLIKTYRDGEDHELLMSIRNGDYLNGNTPTPEFQKLLDHYKNKFDEACRCTKLPDEVDWEQISRLQENLFYEAYFEGGFEE